MVAVNNREKCCYCAGCLIVCPVAAIELQETKIVVNKEKCNDCSACVRVCPVGAMTLEKWFKMPVVKIDLLDGKTSEQKEKLAKSLVKAFEENHILKEWVTIIFNENPVENWAVGGEMLSEKIKKEKWLVKKEKWYGKKRKIIR